MFSTEWEQAEHSSECASSRDQPPEWDLEDALARAILGDISDDHTPPRSTASSASFRDEAEEERLIERLHARLFPAGTQEQPEGKRPDATRTAATARQPRALQRRPQQLARKPLRTGDAVAPSPLPRRSMSPEKINQMVARFRLHDAKRARKVAMLQRQQSLASSTSVSSVSDIMSRHSRELTQHLPDFQRRQELAKAARDREIERRRHHEEQQLERLSNALVENVRTPCICGAGSSAESPTRGTHTPACVRFMDSCEKVDASSEIQKKKLLMRRSIDDMFRFHEEKKRKQLARAELQRRQEQQETTFTPHINDNSRNIYEEMVETGRLHTSRLPERVESPPPTPPALCARSKLVLQTQRKTDPKARQQQRHLSMMPRSSTGSVGSTGAIRRIRPVLFPKAASFSESHWIKQAKAAASAARKDTPPTSPVPAAQAPWTEVEFDSATCGFVLENFGQPKWFSEDQSRGRR